MKNKRKNIKFEKKLPSTQNGNRICSKNLIITYLPRKIQNKKYKICRDQKNWAGNVMSECSQHSLLLSTKKYIFPHF